MLIVSSTDVIMNMDMIAEIFIDRYQKGFYCVKASLKTGQIRYVVTDLDREQAETAELAIVDAYVRGKKVMNFSRKYDGRLRLREEEGEGGT